MDEVSVYNSYGEYKKALDNELQKTAEGFVKIGFLLKQARDTDILKESGYKNYIDFAQTEYGIDKTTVSRFIRINDKFAENGNSEQLLEQYRGFGYAKLSIMLQLPDEVNDIITPDLSKSEINTLKDEVDEERKVSDLEILMEQEPERTKNIETTLDKAMMQLLHDETELYIGSYECFKDDLTSEEKIKKLADILAPAETKVYTIRIPGIGRLMISLRGLEREIEIVNVRSGEKETFTWEAMLDTATRMCAVESIDAKEAWSKLYLEKFPEEEKPKVALVQQKKSEPKKQKKVTKAKVEKAKETKVPKTLHDIEPDIPEPSPIEPEEQPEDTKTDEMEKGDEQQLPGQDSIENHPEYMPDEPEKEEKEPEITENETKSTGNITENAENSMTDNKNINKGYKSAITNNLNTLQNLWNSGDPHRIEKMISILDDLHWRLRKVEEIEDTENEED